MSSTPEATQVEKDRVVQSHLRCTCRLTGRRVQYAEIVGQAAVDTRDGLTVGLLLRSSFAASASSCRTVTAVPQPDKASENAPITTAFFIVTDLPSENVRQVSIVAIQGTVHGFRRSCRTFHKNLSLDLRLAVPASSRAGPLPHLAELEYLRMENAYLKKLEEIREAPNRSHLPKKKRSP